MTPHPAGQLIMVRRVEATQAVVDAWKGRPFVWGENDCGRLAAAILARLGHPPGLARFGGYRTFAAAVRALRRRGFADMADVMDDLDLARIPPAATLPGDLLGFRHPEQPLGVGLAVAVGNGRMLAFGDNGDGPRCHIWPSRHDVAGDGVEHLAWAVDPR